MSFSQFTQDDFALIEKEFAPLWEAVEKRVEDPEERALVRKAFDFANEAHKNVRRRSGEPYILHPIAVAKIVVSDIGLGCKSISAALLHDVVEDTDYTVEDLRNLFGDKIASLVEGLTKIKVVLDNEQKNKMNDIFSESVQAENFKRILLTLNDDVRVVLIKLADRLHNCRTIEYMPEHKRDKILSETMFIFIPLANRLGLYSIKTEMENIWLRFKEPVAYEEICRSIKSKTDGKEEEIDEFIAPIERVLKNAGYTFRIKKRVKTPYSIWKKMQVKHVTFDQIYDLYAVRIIFDADGTTSERDQCWKIWTLITGIYRYMNERQRDWVGNPKSNGYEALHCTLLSQRGTWIEVQIRSRRMDDIAEKGIAAHWAYKKNGYISESDSQMDLWLERVKEIITNPDVGAIELLDIIHNDLVNPEIIVFTPKGEQRRIQNGATALDFAYLIHTEIGSKAIAAKINMRLVPLSTRLKTGDQVEILTAAAAEPKLEWLQFVRTRKARSIIVDYFKEDRQRAVDYGRSVVEMQVKAAGGKLDEATEKMLAQEYRMQSPEDLYFNVGIGAFKPGDIQEVIKKSHESSSRSLFSILFRRDRTKALPKESLVIASCCHPIPGDAVIGFRSPEDGTVTVHKKSCPVAESLASRHGDWVVVPSWEEQSTEGYPVKISLEGLDRRGLLNEISGFISVTMGVNIRNITLGARDGIFRGTIEMFVANRSVLDNIIKNLESIDGVQTVARKEI